LIKILLSRKGRFNYGGYLEDQSINKGTQPAVSAPHFSSTDEGIGVLWVQKTRVLCDGRQCGQRKKRKEEMKKV
jgi:hypothetical protein